MIPSYYFISQVLQSLEIIIVFDIYYTGLSIKYVMNMYTS